MSFSPPVPANEKERIKALRRFALLDTPPEPAFDLIAELATKIFGTEMALVTLVDEKRQWFKARVGIGISETSRESSFCAHAINFDHVTVITDTHADERFRENPLVVGEPNIRFYAGAPLVTEDGFPLGTVCVLDKASHGEFSSDQQAILTDLADLAAHLIQTHRTFASTELLSGLPNRTQFLGDLSSLIASERASSKLFVISVELMGAEEYNRMLRVLGHGFGDEFIVACARVLRSLIPKSFSIYHFSHYRFALLMAADEFDEISPILERVSNVLRRPITSMGIPVSTSLKMGVATFPGDGSSALELMRASVVAANEKPPLGAAWVHYSTKADRSYRRGYRLLSDLRAGLQSADQLSLHYQPKINMRTGACVGAEALFRWHHPELGVISPGEIIPLIEQTGLIKQTTEWVLDEAVSQLATWRYDLPEFRIAINISVENLADPEFSRLLERVLSRHKLEARSIELEVTETALMQDSEAALLQLRAIRHLGIEIAIDDFGTGQSAMSYLKHIPASAVKIDQVFVRALEKDPVDRLIVKSMIDLAHSLNLRVVAEGIENTDIRDQLIEMSCDEGQGYFIARPLPANDVVPWVKAAAKRRAQLASGDTPPLTPLETAPDRFTEERSVT